MIESMPQTRAALALITFGSRYEIEVELNINWTFTNFYSNL